MDMLALCSGSYEDALAFLEKRSESRDSEPLFVMEKEALGGGTLATLGGTIGRGLSSAWRGSGIQESATNALQSSGLPQWWRATPYRDLLTRAGTGAAIGAGAGLVGSMALGNPRRRRPLSSMMLGGLMGAAGGGAYSLLSNPLQPTTPPIAPPPPATPSEVPESALQRGPSGMPSVLTPEERRLPPVQQYNSVMQRGRGVHDDLLQARTRAGSDSPLGSYDPTINVRRSLNSLSQGNWGDATRNLFSGGEELAMNPNRMLAAGTGAEIARRGYGRFMVDPQLVRFGASGNADIQRMGNVRIGIGLSQNGPTTIPTGRLGSPVTASMLQNARLSGMGNSSVLNTLNRTRSPLLWHGLSQALLAQHLGARSAQNRIPGLAARSHGLEVGLSDLESQLPR